MLFFLPHFASSLTKRGARRSTSPRRRPSSSVCLSTNITLDSASSSGGLVSIAAVWSPYKRCVCAALRSDQLVKVKMRMKNRKNIFHATRKVYDVNWPLSECFSHVLIAVNGSTRIALHDVQATGEVINRALLATFELYMSYSIFFLVFFSLHAALVSPRGVI